jgi:hypothetical protein
VSSNYLSWDRSSVSGSATVRCDNAAVPQRSGRSADTDPDAERVQLDLLRAASPAQRAGLAVALTTNAIAASRRALERGSPDATEEEIDLRFVELNYGPELAAAVATCLRLRRR